jgi:hypothetical protein
MEHQRNNQPRARVVSYSEGIHKMSDVAHQRINAKSKSAAEIVARIQEDDGDHE